MTASEVEIAINAALNLPAFKNVDEALPAYIK